MRVIYKVLPYRLIQVRSQRTYKVQRRFGPFIWITTFEHTYLYPAEHEFRRVAFTAHVGEAA